jgi:rfaE bifunctional protein kinase chain/domain
LAKNSKKTVARLFEDFKKVNVLIIGDVMIDAYLWGKVDRISPEAPVPIVSVSKRENRLGGAANVALNVQAMGATPVLCSVIGNDYNGRTFIEILQQLNMSPDGLVQSAERPTTRKTRVIGNNYQMLRVDEEKDEDISLPDRKRLINRISSILQKNKIDVIIIEDYDKGVISKSLIEQVVKIARQHKVPIAVDPKKRNFNHYKNINLFKPNLKELRDGMKLDLEKANLNEIREAVKKLRKDHNLDTVLLTLSERGILLMDGKHETIIPAHIRNIADVSGAGDTVISIAALCLALKCNPVTGATLANLAGGLVCEKVGVVPVEKDLLYREAGMLELL